jgi:hypothetical protein
MAALLHLDRFARSWGVMRKGLPRNARHGR